MVIYNKFIFFWNKDVVSQENRPTPNYRKIRLKLKNAPDLLPGKF